MRASRFSQFLLSFACLLSGAKFAYAQVTTQQAANFIAASCSSFCDVSWDSNAPVNGDPSVMRKHRRTTLRVSGDTLQVRTNIESAGTIQGTGANSGITTALKSLDSYTESAMLSRLAYPVQPEPLRVEPTSRLLTTDVWVIHVRCSGTGCFQSTKELTNSGKSWSAAVTMNQPLYYHNIEARNNDDTAVWIFGWENARHMAQALNSLIRASGGRYQATGQFGGNQKFTPDHNRGLANAARSPATPGAPATRYPAGAIAWNNRHTFRIDYAPTVTEAKQKALAECNQTVGECYDSGLAIQPGSYGCWAIIIDSNSLLDGGTGSDRTAASLLGMQTCRNFGGTQCRVAYTGCNG